MSNLAITRRPWQPCHEETWESLQVKRRFRITLGKMLQNEPSSPDDCEVPYLKAQHVQWHEIRLDDLPVMWASPADIRSLQLQCGDLLVCEGGEVGRGSILRNPPPENCIIQNALHRVRGLEGNDTRYLGYLLRHAATHGWFDVLCNRSTIAHFTTEKFGEMWVALPSCPTQRAIADYLDRETGRLDALVAAKERLLGLLAEKRRALITRAVTRGLPAEAAAKAGLNPNAPLRDSGLPWLGQIPKHWETWKVAHFAKVGNGSTPSRENAEYWSGGTFPWLNSSVVNLDAVTEADQFVTELALSECHLPLVQPGSVLIGITGQGKTRGQAAVLTFQATINQHIAYITPTPEQVDSKFLWLWFVASYDYLRSVSDDAGGTKGAITCELLAELRVPLPPVPEQRAIVAHIERETGRLDAVRSATERTIALLKERRAALIAAAVTGKIPVTVMNNGEGSW